MVWRFVVYREWGYGDLTAAFQSYSLPVVFSEYGCNIVEPRTFGEVDAMYGDQMTPWLSGGFL